MKRPSAVGLFRLKFRFQFMLLWLPAIVGLAAMVVGGYLFGLALASFFGVDPTASLSKQPAGGQYFMVLMVVLVALLLAGAATTYIGVWLALRAAYRDAAVVRKIMKGLSYPEQWYARPG